MRVAVITSTQDRKSATNRRADAMARYLASRGDTVVRLPSDTPRLRVRSRIIPVSLPGRDPTPKGWLKRLVHAPTAIPWALKVAGHLRLQGPFGAVLAADPELALAAASIFRYRQSTPFAVNMEGPAPRWSLELLKRADAILVPDEATLAAAVDQGIDSGRLHICPTPADPGLGDLRRRRNQSRRALGLSQDSFVTLCPDLSEGDDNEGAVREAAEALAQHGVFRFLLPSGFKRSRGCRPLPDGFEPLLAYAAADAVCLCPADRGNELSTNLIEAMAAGRPALLMADPDSTTANVLAESESGNVLPWANAASLRVATFGLWADPKLTARIGMNGQRWVEERHSVHQSGVVLAEILDTLGQPTGGAIAAL